MNKKIACILLLSMLCSLAGCAKRDKEENIRASGDVIQQAGAGSGYHLSYTALPEEFAYSSVQTKLNDGIYLAGEGLDGKAIHGTTKRFKRQTPPPSSLMRFKELTHRLQYKTTWRN